jgi:hypothetical protein
MYGNNMYGDDNMYGNNMYGSDNTYYATTGSHYAGATTGDHNTYYATTGSYHPGATTGDHNMYYATTGSYHPVATTGDHNAYYTTTTTSGENMYHDDNMYDHDDNMYHDDHMYHQDDNMYHQDDKYHMYNPLQNTNFEAISKLNDFPIQEEARHVFFTNLQHVEGNIIISDNHHLGYVGGYGFSRAGEVHISANKHLRSVELWSDHGYVRAMRIQVCQALMCLRLERSGVKSRLI